MSKRFSRGLVLFLSCGFVFTASPAWAQNTGMLLGDVTDPSGAAVVKATVSATDNATKTTHTARTDSAGSYSFAQLAPGVYTVKVTVQSFKTYVADQVNVAVATPTTLNVRLELGSQSEQVTVTVPVTPSLNTTDATIGNPFSEKEVKDLPFLARNVVNLLTLQPGVVSTGQSDTDLLQMGASSNDVLDRREGAVNGMRGTQGNVTVDGADANDYQNEVAFTSAIQLTLDSVQEFRVTTASDNASAGGAAGARVALVTKSGSNEFHGNTRWYYRSAGATANSFFNNATGLPRPQLQRNIGGGSLGGRVVPDRLFFFVDVEARRDNSQKPAGPRIIPSDALRDGVLVYQCVNASQCPGGTVQGLTGPHTISPGAFALTPAQFKQLDPAGLGVDPAEIQYMAIDPHGNDPSVSPDNGLSFNGLVFNAPLKTASNIYTARMDYNLTKDGRHSLMWRGSLAGIKADLLEGNFPGQPVASQLLNNSRGLAAQYNAQFRPNLTNTFGWGFTRLGVNQSGSTALQYQVSLFDDITSYFRGLGRTVPVNEFRDDVTWGKGAHTWQFGGVVRFVRNTRYDDSHVYPGWFNTAGRFCARGCRDFVNALAPSGFPQAADPSSATWAVVALTGSIANATAAFYVDPKTGNLIPPGIPKTELRHMDENDIEWYAQDTWRVRPTLSLVAGLRYSYESPVWEQNGIQVCPTEGLVQWFQSRVSNMNMGLPSDASPLLSWDLCGPANHKSSWWNPNRNNFGPRLSLAWSPGFQSSPLRFFFGGSGKSSLRLGSGIYYDRVGQPLAAGTDLIGSPGLGAGGNATPGHYSLATAPRFSGSCTSAGCTGVPALDLYFPIATNVSYPFTPKKGGQTMGIDQNLRTPYAIDLTLSFERQLPKGVVVSVGYVGTLGRKLLTKADFSQWLNLRDAKSGTTLYHALDQVVAFGGRSNPYVPVIDPKNAAALKAIPDIPYFNNVYPNMAAFDAASFCSPSQPACRAMYQSLTPTQAMYSYLMQSGAPSWGTTMLQLDTSETALGVTPYNSTLDPQGDGYVLFTKQNFQTLPTWVNWGNSHYHSLQVSARKNAGPAIFSANYVFSKSIDNTSVAENTAEPTGTYFGGSLHGQLPNSFDVGAGRAVSDFDLRHNFNASLVVNLPFGRGGKIGVHANRALNALIGGWELSGLVRWRSGFPMSPTNGSSAPLNIYDQALATLAQPESTSLTKNGVNGVPNLFNNPSAVFAQLQFTDPGQAGSRNVFRGPAYADLDLGVYKTFRMPWKESHQLQFRATAFNTLNSVNFASAGDVRDTGGFILDMDSPSTFGQITNTAGPRGGAREMEFAVRYQF